MSSPFARTLPPPELAFSRQAPAPTVVYAPQAQPGPRTGWPSLSWRERTREPRQRLACAVIEPLTILAALAVALARLAWQRRPFWLP
jgi:hypothetical protein